MDLWDFWLGCPAGLVCSGSGYKELTVNEKNYFVDKNGILCRVAGRLNNQVLKSTSIQPLKVKPQWQKPAQRENEPCFPWGGKTFYSRLWAAVSETPQRACCRYKKYINKLINKETAWNNRGTHPLPFADKDEWLFLAAMSSFVGSTQGIVPPPAEELCGSLGTERRERMWRERVAARAEERGRERRAKERSKTVGERSQHQLRKMGALPHNSPCSYIMYIYSRKAAWSHRQGWYVTSHSVKTQKGRWRRKWAGWECGAATRERPQRRLKICHFTWSPWTECEPAASVTWDEEVNEVHLEDQNGSERNKPTDNVDLHLGTA